MRKTNEEPLKEVIDKLLEQYRLKAGLEELNLAKGWKDIVGEHNAKHTTNVWLKKGTLTVELDSSVLREELGYAKEVIKHKVNDYLGRESVQKVVLR